jgi:hypothetical protein
MLRFGNGFIIGVGVALFIASAANAKTYRFRVNCADETYVAQWEADSPDLDKDYFRVATGDANLDCSIYDYDARTDRNLPQRWCSGPSGIIRGFPPLLILSGLSHCR